MSGLISNLHDATGFTIDRKPWWSIDPHYAHVCTFFWERSLTDTDVGVSSQHCFLVNSGDMTEVGADVNDVS